MMRRMPTRCQGFTLIEILIALTLFTLIMLGLVAGLYTLGNSLDRAEAKAEQISEITLVSSHLRQLLTETAPIKHPDGLEPNPYFNGTDNELTWVGNLSAYQGPGGMHRMRLRVEENDSESAKLILQYRRIAAELEQVPSFSSRQQQRLVTKLESMQIRYQNQDQQWQNDWRDPERLPLAISIIITAAGQQWPELVVQLQGGRGAYQ